MIAHMERSWSMMGSKLPSESAVQVVTSRRDINNRQEQYDPCAASTVRLGLPFIS
jgi:hypothetical protein